MGNERTKAVPPATFVVAVDFDGTISKYTEWKGDRAFGEVIDHDNCIKELDFLRSNGAKIVIWSTRTEVKLMEAYLMENGIPFDEINHNPWAPKNVIDCRKIHADVYIDDKGITFNGSWKGMALKIRSFLPWWKDFKEDHVFIYPDREIGKTGPGIIADLKPVGGQEAKAQPFPGSVPGNPSLGQDTSLDELVPAGFPGVPPASIYKSPIRKAKGQGGPVLGKVLPTEAPAPPRKCLPLTVAGFHCDQIALFTEDAEATVERYKKLGYKNWIIDEVEAACRYFSNDEKEVFDYALSKIYTFRVKLCFNYEIMPCEFEVLQLIQGLTPQISIGAKFGLSHLGFHVINMKEAISRYEALGYNLIAYIETLKHSSAPNRYCYAYIDTSPLGYITKLIKKQTGDAPPRIVNFVRDQLK